MLGRMKMRLGAVVAPEEKKKGIIRMWPFVLGFLNY